MDNKIVILLVAGAVLLGVVGVVLLMVLVSSFPHECVAVIKVDGELATSSSSGGLFGGGAVGSDDLAELIKQADSRPEVKSVLFEINSPGGSVVASREIYEAVKGLGKPKVAYIREVGASGGYYIALGADRIVSNPDAITGSIGVVSTHQEMSGLFEKIGINTTVMKTGEHKDMGNPARELTEEERAIIQGILEEMFQEFKGEVVSARGGKLDMAEFSRITDGRILTGRQAYKAGLVDELGNKDTALGRAGEMAGFDGEPPVCNIETEKGLLYELFNGMGRGLGEALTSVKSAGSGWGFGYR